MEIEAEIKPIEIVRSGDICETPEQTIKDAIEQSKKAVEASHILLLEPWTQAQLNQVSGALSYQFEISQESIMDWLIDKLRDEIHTVTNAKALPGWLFRVGDNYCKNLYKHSKVIKRHEEYVEHMRIAGKRNSVPIAVSGSPTPEEHLIEKEEQAIQDARMLEIRAAVRRIIMEDVIIASEWGKGNKPEVIASQISKSVATVYRKLGIMQKAVIDEIGVIETEENKGLIKDGLRELFANSLDGAI